MANMRVFKNIQEVLDPKNMWWGGSGMVEDIQVRYDDSNYSLAGLPGCPAVAISHYAYVNPEHRGKGVGQLRHEERLRIAEVAGCGLIICTVNSTNDVEKHILSKNGWDHLTTFRNEHQDSWVELWGKTLDKKEDS